MNQSFLHKMELSEVSFGSLGWSSINESVNCPSEYRGAGAVKYVKDGQRTGMDAALSGCLCLNTLACYDSLGCLS
jgi:hypothetical protein